MIDCTSFQTKPIVSRLCNHHLPPPPHHLTRIGRCRMKRVISSVRESIAVEWGNTKVQQCVCDSFETLQPSYNYH